MSECSNIRQNFAATSSSSAQTKSAGVQARSDHRLHMSCGGAPDDAWADHGFSGSVCVARRSLSRNLVMVPCTAGNSLTASDFLIGRSRMSAKGQKQSLRRAIDHVRYGPEADILLQIA